jgi:hypothetical protein
MPDRSIMLLRLLCLVLAGAFAFQLSKVFLRRDPFKNVRVPPVLRSDVSEAKPSTNGPVNTATNLISTNIVQKTSTNVTINSNIANAASSKTNLTVLSTNASSTNLVNNATNRVGTNMVSGTNALLPPGLSSRAMRGGPGPAFPPGMMMGRPGMPGAKAPDLPGPIQARVDKIVNSEILGAIVRPMPMALLGIAGKDAFIRGPNGQTGLVREGEEFGGIKLLKIGINRILIEQENEKKELMLFSGFGGESLLSKEKENSK